MTKQSFPNATWADRLPSDSLDRDLRLVLPFIHATRRAFSTMMKVEVEIDAPFEKEDSLTTHDVTSVVGFSGEIIGSVIISFQSQSASQFVCAFTGAQFEVKSTDFADAVAELANIIAGDAKKDLGGVSSISIPTVIVGRGHTIARLSDVPCIVIPCRTPVGNFTIEINIKPAK